MKCDKKYMKLYAVTDRSWLNGHSLTDMAAAAIEGGITCLQLREKELEHDEFLKEALELKKLCAGAEIPLIINDNVDLAIECKADGIHIGQHDTAADIVKKRIGDSMMLGVSAQTVEQAVKAERDGADYLGVGAVFSTGTKTDADDVDYDTLKAICDAVSIPVVAIGGINLNNISALSGSGIDGIAVVSAIFASDAPKAAAKRLYECVSTELSL